MRPDQVVEVVGLLGIAFAQPISAETFEVYEPALEDLDVVDHRGLVKTLLRTMKRWPSPAVLREAILSRHGLLAPDEDQAWTMVVDYAGKGEGFEHLPEPVREALTAVGGTWSIKHHDRGVVHAQFRDAYRKAKERADRGTLEASWNGLALTGGQHGRELLARHG